MVNLGWDCAVNFPENTCSWSFLLAEYRSEWTIALSYLNIMADAAAIQSDVISYNDARRMSVAYWRCMEVQ